MTLQKPEQYGTEIETGLEDFGMEDAVIPRLSIVHKEGQFKDSLSNEQFDTINVIILGLVKQRVLWHPDIEDGDWPMCRSANHEIGFPNTNEKQPKEKTFPWAKAGFDPNDFPADDAGHIRLPCSGCQLKEWKSHPDGKKPYCTEQFTLPVLYDPRDSGDYVPAIITFQKTGLKPLKSYLTSFARSRQPAYTAITQIGLDMAKRGSTDYSIPNFRRIGDSDESDWREYAVNYRTMRDFLTADPGERDEDEDGTPPAPSANVAEAPPQAEPAAKEEPVEAVVVEEPKASAPAAPASAPADDDDLPF